LEKPAHASNVKRFSFNAAFIYFNMKQTISQLQKIIVDYGELLKNIDEAEFVKKPLANKWSKKEILGHAIDSAQNNLRRFIVSQYEMTPLIIYNQDQWVAISNYNANNTADMIELWRLLNRQICVVLSNTSDKASIRTCETNNGNVYTIDWLAKDYVKHLLHHLHQILELEPVAYP